MSPTPPRTHMRAPSGAGRTRCGKLPGPGLRIAPAGARASCAFCWQAWRKARRLSVILARRAARKPVRA